MDGYDPEKRIAELERQLAEARAASDPGPNPAYKATGNGLTPERVRDVAFSRPPPGKRGYHEGEVDAFLDRVEAALRDPKGRTLTSEQVRDMVFSRPPLGKRGYHEGEVDAFLDRVEAALGRPGESDTSAVGAVEESAASRQFVATSAWGRKFLITVTGDGLTVDRRRGDVYPFVDAQLGPWVVMGVALHLQCGRHRFSLGGKDRRVGPATGLDAPPVHSVDASLAASDFDELLFSVGGRWSGSAARGPAPGEPTRCLLFPNPDLIHKMGPFSRRKIGRLIRSQSELQLVIDVDNDWMRVIDPNTNAINASAALPRVTATPAIYHYERWYADETFYRSPAMAVCLPGMQPLTIACREARAEWRGTVPERHDPPAYTVSVADWLTLVEKLGLAEG